MKSPRGSTNARRRAPGLVALGLAVALSGVSGCGAHPAAPNRVSGGKTAALPSTKKSAVFTPITDELVVPDVVGDNYGAAQLRLATTGSLGVQVAYRLVHDSEVLAGNVVTQSPSAGAAVSSNQTVTLFVSEGPARVANAAPCTAADLRARSGPSVSEATGQHTLDISVQNVSRATCVLKGHPTVSLLDAHGRGLGFHYTHRGDQMTTGAPPSAVYLPPGADAWVRLNKYRCDVTVTDHAATVALGLPRGGGSITLRLPGPSHAEYFSHCDEAASLTVAVSPFEPVSILLWPSPPSP